VPFLMLTSGGEPLQLTNDEGNKSVDDFSADGKEVYYDRNLGHDEVWAVPTAGGAPRRVASGFHAVPSPDGAFIYHAEKPLNILCHCSAATYGQPCQLCSHLPPASCSDTNSPEPATWLHRDGFRLAA
jgi:hypothetical protein